ncbi:hypothetical protein V3C52_17650 [Escherichia coli]
MLIALTDAETNSIPARPASAIFSLSSFPQAINQNSQSCGIVLPGAEDSMSEKGI